LKRAAAVEKKMEVMMAKSRALGLVLEAVNDLADERKQESFEATREY